jgi:dTDP-glucose 4,6-dehydratase
VKISGEKIVVIGSNSFSGSHFVNHCLNEGMSVIGISRSVEPDKVFLPYKININLNKYKFYQFDLNNDLIKIIDIIKDTESQYIVNFAAQGMVAQSWESPEDWFQTNTLSNVMLHNQLRNLSFLKKYVHISTPEVYGSCRGLIKEKTIYQPSTPYAVSRAATDMSLMSFYNAYNFPVVFTRAANVFGSGQQLFRIIPITILKFLTGQKLQLHGGGHSVRSFINIKDVVEGTLKATLSGKPGEIFHFSTKENISIKSLVEKISSLMNVAFESNVEIVGERLGKDSAYLLDSTNAHEKLDWEPKISLEEGIKETISWVEFNIDILSDFPWEYIHKK